MRIAEPMQNCLTSISMRGLGIYKFRRRLDGALIKIGDGVQSSPALKTLKTRRKQNERRNNLKFRRVDQARIIEGIRVALGGLALGAAGVSDAHDAHTEGQCALNGCGYPADPRDTREYDYPNYLPEYWPDKMQSDLDRDEMRITILGSAFPPARKAQQMMSIFVEVGPWIPDGNGGPGKATDSFVFDCGSGVVTNYNAMGISYGRMDKVFITHLHADHMSDLSTIYCFGPSEDRKSPLFVWGQGPSGIQSPAWGNNPPKRYDDGVNAFCKHLREAMRWHSESFSFLSTGAMLPPDWENWKVPGNKLEPVSDDPMDDGFAMVPIQLDWNSVGGLAYHNPRTGVKITHFPVIHTRKGSMGYKLEWKGLSMVYTSDTRPETNCLAMGSGVDVFIHEMILPPELLAMKNLGLRKPRYDSPEYLAAVEVSKTIINSSHSPQGAVGYLLSQINPRPKLSVIAHFPVANDTVRCAMKSIQAHFPRGRYPEFGRDIIWATDLIVLKVKKNRIEQYIGKVPDYAYTAKMNLPAAQDMNDPKYPSNTYQLDLTTLIQPGKDTYCEDGY
jgi:ribonuclease Z